jgi:hypothetical protein
VPSVCSRESVQEKIQKSQLQKNALGILMCRLKPLEWVILLRKKRECMIRPVLNEQNIFFGEKDLEQYTKYLVTYILVIKPYHPSC